MLLLLLLPSLAHAAYTVTIDWSQAAGVSKLIPTLQVVPNAAAFRSSPIHDAVWGNLAALGAEMVRLQLWLPFPGMGVAALEPPSPPGKQCGFRAGDSPAYNTFTLDCQEGSTIAAVDFAVYGQFSGVCGSLQQGACAAPSARAAVEAVCLGQQRCTVEGSAEWMGGAAPCASAATGVQVACTGNQTYTSWDFSHMDTTVLDFFNATAGAAHTVVDFSTPPQWLYTSAGRVPPPDDPEATTWHYEQGGELRDPTATEISEYYARVLAWYTEGGFTDESGRHHASALYLNFTVWEYLNEMEHGLSPEAYTRQYDAVVLAQRRLAPRGSSGLKYMGLALEQSNSVQEYFSYFLNMSNHAADVPPPDYASFHYYAGAPTRSNVSGYEGIFCDIDEWMPNVQAALALRDALSPATELDMDEVGVILPNDNSYEWTGDAPGFPQAYWNACAASFLYRFILNAPLGLDYMGDSALAQIPNMSAVRGSRWVPQFPSVSLLDWTTGAPTARYRLLQLLMATTSRGMRHHATTASPTYANPFCGAGVNLGGGRAARVDLACAPVGGGLISAVLLAAYGELPPGDGGACPTALPPDACAANFTALVRAACVGRANCSLSWDDAHGDPCPNSIKTFQVTAQCSGAAGGAMVGPASLAPVVALGVSDASTPATPRRVLILNRSSRPQSVSVEGSEGGAWTVVDEESGGGPPRVSVVPASLAIALGPFAAGVLTMP
jgi:hypothetical protein